MAYNKDIAERSEVTAALAKAGYPLRAAAEEFGVGYQHLANVARGRTHPSRPVIEGFERVTGRPLAEFVPRSMLVKPYNEACRTRFSHFPS